RGRVFVSSEGVEAPVLRVPLPAAVRDAVEPEEPEEPRPGPATAPDGSGGLGVDLTEVEEADRPEWPWFLGGFVAL
ncbi:hypothetical protein QWY28_23975, partial [Nocardioides sp. SOB77]